MGINKVLAPMWNRVLQYTEAKAMKKFDNDGAFVEDWIQHDYYVQMARPVKHIKVNVNLKDVDKMVEQRLKVTIE